MNENEQNLDQHQQKLLGQRKDLIPIYMQKQILEKKINKCICKIEYTNNGKYILGTGFFCKIPKINIICLLLITM